MWHRLSTMTELIEQKHTKIGIENGSSYGFFQWLTLMHAKVGLLAIPVPHLQTAHPRREISLSYCPSTHSQVITSGPAERKQPEKTHLFNPCCSRVFVYLSIFMFYINICAQCIYLLCDMCPSPILTHTFSCMQSQTMCTSKKKKLYSLTSIPDLMWFTLSVYV